MSSESSEYPTKRQRGGSGDNILTDVNQWTHCFYLVYDRWLFLNQLNEALRPEWNDTIFTLRFSETYPSARHTGTCWSSWDINLVNNIEVLHFVQLHSFDICIILSSIFDFRLLTHLTVRTQTWLNLWGSIQFWLSEDIEVFLMK